MQKALDDIGVHTGQAGIAAFGFQGLLAKLKDTVGGSDAAIAKLDPNIRGMAAFFRLAGAGAKSFNVS